MHTQARESLHATVLGYLVEGDSYSLKPEHELTCLSVVVTEEITVGSDNKIIMRSELS